MRPGPSSQIPFMRPDNDAAWNSNKAAGPAAADDYARAIAQREAQDRRAAAAERQRQAQEAAAARKSRQDTAAEHRARMRDMAAEVREYESAQRARARADAQLQRSRERADRAEAAINRQADSLRHRAGRPLTPNAHEAIQRQASLLRDRSAGFARSYGRVPSGVRGLDSTLAGMGSHANTYASQGILGLGARGQRAAEDRSWMGLGRIEAELRRIERVNVAILANDRKSTAEQKTDARRNLEAIRGARARIGAGRSGNSGAMNLAGDAVGAIGAFLADPLVGLAAAGVAGAAASPFIAAGLANAAVSRSRPYYNLRERTAAIGRAGGFNSRGLMDRLLPTHGGTRGAAPRLGRRCIRRP